MTDFLPEGHRIGSEENRLYTESLDGLRRAMEEETLLEARATLCDRGTELRFSFGGIEGVMPRDEVAVTEDDEPIRDIAVICRVGKPSVFCVEYVEEGARPRIHLSRRRAQEKCLREYLDRLEEGDIIPARVTHFEPFGAFCDIGCGIPSLLSIDCISVSRISHPSDRFRIGEDILAAVKTRDERRLGQRGRIALTHKELLGTWQENADRFQIGQTVIGIVRSIESYGIFVELAPNLAGLAEWKEGVRVGDGCAVYIKNIIPQKMKVKLVLIDTFRLNGEEKKFEYFQKEGSVRGFSYPPQASE